MMSTELLLFSLPFSLFALQKELPLHTTRAYETKALSRVALGCFSSSSGISLLVPTDTPAVTQEAALFFRRADAQISADPDVN